MTEDQIKYMVNRFLGWKLPDTFAPDDGISFDPIINKGHPFEARRTPSGANLFDATQADTIVRYMIDCLPTVGAPDTEFAWLIERGDSKVSRPLYWMGTDHGSNHTVWTHDPNNCIRFARELDAVTVAHNLMGRGDGRILCRVKEHGWG